MSQRSNKPLKEESPRCDKMNLHERLCVQADQLHDFYPVNGYEVNIPIAIKHA